MIDEPAAATETRDVRERNGCFMFLGHLFAAAACGLIFVAPDSARAEAFTWTPHAVGLDGSAFTADTLHLSDYAQVTFGTGGTTFTDTGILPIIGYSLAGQAVTPAGYGTNWGAYIQYTGTGSQIVSPQGFPESATFAALTYQIVGYNGVASFDFTPSGASEATGALSGVTTLEQGSLLTGDLAFIIGSTGLSIIGNIIASIDNTAPGFQQAALANLAVTFIHPPGEYSFMPDGSLRIAGGDQSSASLVSPVEDPAPVPEPASLLLLGLGVAGLAVARRCRTG